MLLLVLLLFVFIFLFNTKAMYLFMEARFRHWIQNKKGYCNFLSHNSDFVSENCDFIAISCLYHAILNLLSNLYLTIRTF